jgi:hypothetical protein
MTKKRKGDGNRLLFIKKAADAAGLISFSSQIF